VLVEAKTIDCFPQVMLPIELLTTYPEIGCMYSVWRESLDRTHRTWKVERSSHRVARPKRSYPLSLHSSDWTRKSHPLVCDRKSHPTGW